MATPPYGFLGRSEEAARAATKAREERERSRYDPLRDLGRGAAAFGQLGEQGYGAWGGRLGGVADRLERQAMGQDSISAEQLRQGLQRGLAQQRSLAASARPGNAAMMARRASMNAANMSSGLAGQQAMAGIAERNAANLALGQLGLGVRGQDLRAALQGRGQAMGAEGQILTDRTTRSGQPSAWDKALGLGAGILTGGIASGWFSGGGGTQGAPPPRPASGAGTAYSIAPELSGVSDRDRKKNIKEDGSPEVREFMRALKPKEFEYDLNIGPVRIMDPERGPSFSVDSPYSRGLGGQTSARARHALVNQPSGAPGVRGFRALTAGMPTGQASAGVEPPQPGRRIGIMAQDLERSRAGRQMVRQTPGGRVVSTPQLAAGLAAGLGDLNARLERLEGKGRGRK